MFYFVSLQSASLKLIVLTLQYFKQKHQKEKHIKVPVYKIMHCTVCIILYCKQRARNEKCEKCKERKLKNWKQTNMLVSAGCELVVIDDECPIIRDLESPISSAVILQICILNWPCSGAEQCTVYQECSLRLSRI